MMARVSVTRAATTPSPERLAATPRRPVYRVAGIAIAAVGAAWVVWFLGLNPLWAVATVLAVGPVGAALTTLKFEEDATWDPPEPETARGSRIAMATIEQSLAACDRLARPTAVRQLRAIVISEREDRLARPTAVRRMRALLAAELHERGVDPANASHEHTIVTLLGPDALPVLQPNESTPVTAGAIERCLDAVERPSTKPNSSP